MSWQLRLDVWDRPHGHRRRPPSPGRGQISTASSMSVSRRLSPRPVRSQPARSTILRRGHLVSSCALWALRRSGAANRRGRGRLGPRCVAVLAFAAMRRLAQAFYRLVGLAVTLFGAWVLLINLVDVSYSGWILAWILSAGLLGAVGGAIFILSFDGPARLRTRQVRLLGWLGMVFSALMPWSFQFVMLPLVLLTLPALSSPRLSGQPLQTLSSSTE